MVVGHDVAVAVEDESRPRGRRPARRRPRRRSARCSAAATAPPPRPSRCRRRGVRRSAYALRRGRCRPCRGGRRAGPGAHRRRVRRGCPPRAPGTRPPATPRAGSCGSVGHCRPGRAGVRAGRSRVGRSPPGRSRAGVGTRAGVRRSGTGGREGHRGRRLLVLGWVNGSIIGSVRGLVRRGFVPYASGGRARARDRRDRRPGRPAGPTARGSSPRGAAWAPRAPGPGPAPGRVVRLLVGLLVGPVVVAHWTIFSRIATRRSARGVREGDTGPRAAAVVDHGGRGRRTGRAAQVGDRRARLHPR